LVAAGKKLVTKQTAKAVGKRIAKKAGKEAAKGLAENIMNPDEETVGEDGISCLEPEMDGEDMYCPESMVATLDMALDDLVCCAPHDADKLTVDLLSELMVYEDELPSKPSTEKAVGAWWGLLVAGAKKLCTKATAKAVGKHIVKKGKEHVIDSAKDAAWDAAAGAVEDWINPDEAALASVDGISCFEPEVDGEDMYCPEALVPTLDMAEDSLACCAPHEADKLTVDLLSELVVYEDDLPKNPNAAEKEVGAWWGLLVAAGKKLVTKQTAKAVGKRIAKKAGKEAAKGLAENIMNPDEEAVGVDEISCLEPEMDGEDMYCPESMVATLDMALDDLVCCAPHDADKLTVSLLSDLMVYEDQLPEMPATEKAVGAWWGLLVAGAKKLCTKATAKAVGKHIVKKGKEHVIDSAKDAAWDAAAGAVEDWINPDETAREVASVSAVNNSITYPLALIGFVTLLYGAYAMGTSGKYEAIPEAEEI